VSEQYAGRQIVGMDLHRSRSVLVRMTETGEHLETARIANDPEYLQRVIARAGEHPDVVLEATYGWYWAADALAELGANVHLAHPLGVKMFSYRRVKNDALDAADLADLLRMGRLPRAWIAPPATRELRGWVRHRAKLVGLRLNLKCQIHAVLAGAGVQVPMSDLFGARGRELLGSSLLAVESRARVDSLLRMVDAMNFEIDTFDRLVAGRLRTERGYRAIQAIPGPTVGVMGRTDPSPSRIRHRRAPRPNHQTGSPPGPVGRGRGRATRPRAHQAWATSRSGRRTPRPQHRGGRRGPGTDHPGVLRPT
jgi:hypothetical protein